MAPTPGGLKHATSTEGTITCTRQPRGEENHNVNIYQHGVLCTCGKHVTHRAICRRQGADCRHQCERHGGAQTSDLHTPHHNGLTALRGQAWRGHKSDLQTAEDGSVSCDCQLQTAYKQEAKKTNINKRTQAGLNIHHSLTSGGCGVTDTGSAGTIGPTL